jgi:hypothetical protein
MDAFGCTADFMRMPRVIRPTGNHTRPSSSRGRPSRRQTQSRVEAMGNTARSRARSRRACRA